MPNLILPNFQWNNFICSNKLIYFIIVKAPGNNINIRAKVCHFQRPLTSLSWYINSVILMQGFRTTAVLQNHRTPKSTHYQRVSMRWPFISEIHYIGERTPRNTSKHYRLPAQTWVIGRPPKFPAISCARDGPFLPTPTCHFRSSNDAHLR